MTKDNLIISELIDIQGLLVDKVIASTIPLFTIWSLILAAYCLYPERIIAINNASRYLAVLTGGTAVIVLIIGFIAIGTCLYGFKVYGYSHSFLAATFSSSMVVILGLFIRKATKIFIKEKSGINRFAFPLLIICILLGCSAYIYGLLADPLQYWRVIHEAYEIAKNAGQS